jgi:PAS domain S-box-containing protein
MVDSSRTAKFSFPSLGKTLLARLQAMPLRYRMSIPFLFLAFCGTFSLVWLAIRSQNKLIQQHEHQRLFGYYHAFEHGLDLQGRWALSLATIIADDPDLARYLAARDRLKILEHSYPTYLQLKKDYGISQFLFIVPPDRAFLRLHLLQEFGDSLGLYREGSGDAIAQGKGVYGLQYGLTGYGIRGTAPVYYNGAVVGAAEIGFSFWAIFLQQLKKQFGLEASVLISHPEPGSFHTLSTTLPRPVIRTKPIYTSVYQRGQPEILLEESVAASRAILVGPIHDYRGTTMGLVELSADRSGTLSLISSYWRLMLGVGIVGMVLSVGAIYLASHYFTKPIARMVTFAREIAYGKRLQTMPVRPAAEMGVLADALNEMLLSLEGSRQKIRDYTHNLEQMVHLRTLALRESEEKYRTLVENVPLVVYRLLANGKTIFINHFVEALLGIPAGTVLANQNFWMDKVVPEDRPRIWPLMEKCLKQGREFKAEYRVLHASGKTLFVLDHALPVLDEQGVVDTVDGFLEDVTERHQLQQQIIQTEELRTLSEISARLAHEIRNPLVAAGGFARRLLTSVPESDPQRGKVEIIVAEVARLEKILERTIASLKPFEMIVELSSLNLLLMDALEFQRDFLRQHGVTVENRLDPNLPMLMLDRILFKKVLESLLRALTAYHRPSGRLTIQTYVGEGAVHLEMLVDAVQLSDDDIEHFFYPFISQLDDPEALDLPIAKMIVHKHGGMIHLRQQRPYQLSLHISLPVSYAVMDSS